MFLKLNKNEKGAVPTWIIITAIIIVVLVVVLLILGSTAPPEQPAAQKQGELSNQQNQQQQNQQQQQQQQQLKKIFSRTGKITDFQGNKIKFLAPSAGNIDLKEDTEMTAVVSEKTQFVRVTVPKTIPEGTEDIGSLFSRESIGFSDLKIGDKVNVVSSENISNLTEFPALRVEVVEVK
jgi:type II secretory pathway pseudopilin PulG